MPAPVPRHPRTPAALKRPPRGDTAPAVVQAPAMPAPEAAARPVAPVRPAARLDADRIGVFGKSHSGKSSHAKAMVQRAQAAGLRVVAVDPNNEWSAHGKAGAHVELGPLRERCFARELARFPSKVTEADLSLAVVPDGPLPKDGARALELVARLLQAAHDEDSTPTLLVLEEVGDYAPHCLERLRSLGTRGRHAGLMLLVIAQRPALVPIHLRSQLERIDLFRLDEPADCEAIELRTGYALATRVKTLAPFSAITWRAGETTTTDNHQPAAP